MKRHRNRGSAIAEFGPALFILVVLIIFPLIMMLVIGGQYAFGWYHNHLITNELAVRKGSDGGLTGGTPPDTGTTVSAALVKASPVGQEIAAGYMGDNQGVAKFLGMNQINDVVTYFPNRVECSTAIDAKPIVVIEFIGYTQIKFSIASEATREVTAN